MNVLLLRPVPANERFGLGPFFRIEPLGLEYIAAALEAGGHRVTLADLRFHRSLDALVRRSRPDLVGIAAMHALETDEVLTAALGPVLTESYLAVRRSEWDAYSAGDEAFEQQGHFSKY